MEISQDQLKKILLAGSYVSEEDIKTAEKVAKSGAVSVVDYLVSQNVLTKDLVGQAIAESFKVSYADLNSNQPTQEQVLKIPEETATAYRAVLFSENETGVVVATDDPTKEGLQEALTKVFPKKKFTVAYSLSEDIDQIFLQYQKSLETRFSKIIEGQKRVAPEILEEIFEDASTFNASDIHFEPQREEVIVRFRVDGVLHEAGRIPRAFYENILNRVKVQSRLRIDEHFATQDGSMRYESKKEGRSFDIRTSIVPTVEGEKIVLRVLAAYVQGLSLDHLGLSASHQEMLVEASKKPFGMILVVGPTGSGKTTTLYAALKLLHKPEVNITTIEDPVEYKMLGINQIQVNKETDLTFSKGLRSVVRQDPDIILVGEIRDEETAEIAVNAALTGHLLLSTFHANDAATAVPRLLDMNAEPFLLASTLEIIIAQRLVRKICETCKYSTTVSAKELEQKTPGIKKYFTERKITLYAGKGCSVCGNTGFHDRTAIFEFIEVTPQLEELILKNPSAREMWDLARQQGSAPLFEDGIQKVKEGVTTLEELGRVAAPPQE